MKLRYLIITTVLLTSSQLVKANPVIGNNDDDVNGVVMDVGKYRALDGLQKDLLNVIGGGVEEAKNPVVSVGTARKVRQILDKAIGQNSKVFGLTGNETDSLAVQKLAANSIRSALAKEYPDIASLNKEFTFWSNVC